MAWQVRATNTNTGTGTETATVAKPTNTDGDGIVIVFRANVSRTLTAPSGFTLVHSGSHARIFWKTASGEGTGNYSFTWTGQGNTAYAIAAHAFYEDSGLPVVLDVSGGQDTSGTSHSCPTLDAAIRDAWLVGISSGTGAGSALSWTPPSGFTERADVQVGSNSSVTLATRVQADPGSTGSNTFTSSVTPNNAYTALLVFGIETNPRRRHGGVVHAAATHPGPRTPGIVRWARRASGLLAPARPVLYLPGNPRLDWRAA